MLGVVLGRVSQFLVLAWYVGVFLLSFCWYLLTMGQVTRIAGKFLFFLGLGGNIKKKFFFVFFPPKKK